MNKVLMAESKKRKYADIESLELSHQKLEDMSTIELNILLQKSLSLKKELLEKMTIIDNGIKKIELEQQKKCHHVWVTNMDSGPYPCRWSQCSKCQLIN